MCSYSTVHILQFDDLSRLWGYKHHAYVVHNHFKLSKVSPATSPPLGKQSIKQPPLPTQYILRPEQTDYMFLWFSYYWSGAWQKNEYKIWISLINPWISLMFIGFFSLFVTLDGCLQSGDFPSLRHVKQNWPHPLIYIFPLIDEKWTRCIRETCNQFGLS